MIRSASATRHIGMLSTAFGPVVEGYLSDPAVIEIMLNPDGTLRVDPWPFNSPRIDLSIPLRRLPRRQYRDEKDLHETLATAPILQLPLAVAPGA